MHIVGRFVSSVPQTNKQTNKQTTRAFFLGHQMPSQKTKKNF